MSISEIEEDKACPIQRNVEICKIFLGLQVENTDILSIKNPQLAYCKLRVLGLFDQYKIVE